MQCASQSVGYNDWFARNCKCNASALLLLLKEVGSARLRKSDTHPISLKTPAPQYQPVDRKKRKGKIVEDFSRDREA